MTHHFVIFFLILILQPVSWLIGSYAITEKELIAIKQQAQLAWSDIENEESFNIELKTFMDNHSRIPFDIKDSNKYYFKLPEDSNESIKCFKATRKNLNDNQNYINIRSNDCSYSRLIAKAIIIRKSYMEHKGLIASSEIKLWKAYYGLLKGLFLEEKEFLFTVASIIQNEKKLDNLDNVEVCVLKDQVDSRQDVSYYANVPYSVIGSFLFHRLLNRIKEEHNQETNNANVKHKEKNQDDNTKKMNDKEELKANDNNLNNNQINTNNQRCIYYRLASLSTAVILSIFLIKFMPKKHNKKTI